MKLNWEQDPLHPSYHEVQNHLNRRYEEIDRPVQDNEMEEVTSGRICEGVGAVHTKMRISIYSAGV